MKREKHGKVETGSLILGVVVGAAIVLAFGLGKFSGLREHPDTRVEMSAIAAGQPPLLKAGGAIGTKTIGDIAEAASKWVVNIDTIKVVQISPWSMGFGDCCLRFAWALADPMLMQPQSYSKPRYQARG